MVVFEVGREDDVDIDAVPAALRAQLGHDATAGLLDLLDLSHHEARDAVITACTERFERRVVAEVSGLRVDMAKMESGLRQDTAKMESGLRQDITKMESGLHQDMASMESGLRQDMAKMESGLRQDTAKIRQDMTQLESNLRQDITVMEGSLRLEMTGLVGSLRQEMAGLGSSLRGDIAAGRVELFKWCFLFWIGQVLAIGSLMAVMLRVMR